MEQSRQVRVHKENVRAHAARRFRERFGQELTPKMRSWFYRQIESGRSAWLVTITKALGDRSETEVYFVMDRSVHPDPIIAIFCRDWMEIVTFMTPEFYRDQITGAYREEKGRRAVYLRAQNYAGAPDLRKPLRQQDEFSVHRLRI